MTDEIYTIIKQHPKYAISSYGNVLNIKTQRILKQNFHNGFNGVQLNKKFMQIHIIMIKEFYINKGLYIEHINGNTMDNRIKNLNSNLTFYGIYPPDDKKGYIFKSNGFPLDESKKRNKTYY